MLPSTLFFLLSPALSLALPFPSPHEVADILLLRRATSDDDTGCNMNAGSALMECLGDWASVPPVPSATGVLADEASQFTQIANCWGNGTYCREWLPVKTAADKLCALAISASAASSTASSTSSALSSSATVSSNSTSTLSSASSSISTALEAVTADAVASETFSSVVAEASNVITSIWNNDSGTDIPSITNDVGTQTNPTWTHEDSTGGATATGTGASAAASSSSGDSSSSGGGSKGVGKTAAGGSLFFLTAGAAASGMLFVLV
ncbi:hypothetical protein JCM8547_001479 [Rhodosporidiobolus lusitaniae]